METINTQRLQNAEHLALMSDLLVLVKEMNLQPFEGLKNRLQTQVAQAEAGHVQIRKSEHTEELVKLDDHRDMLYRGLVLRVQSELYSQQEDLQKAAQKVLLVVETYGNFTKHNYQKETVEIQNFLADLKSEEYLPSVQKIGVEQWVTWLEDANNKFHQAYTSRRDEYAAQPSFDMKNIRKELDETLKKIMQTAEALEILQPSEPLKTFIAKANASITKWNEIIAQRRKKKGNDSSDETKETSPSE